MCPAQILASQPSITIFWDYQLRAQDTLRSASNKKSIRWMFCLRARVNEASDYQWGVRLSTENKLPRRWGNEWVIRQVLLRNDWQPTRKYLCNFWYSTGTEPSKYPWRIYHHASGL
jgi:hypothetical protein